jgi:REP element-mobilizing transposase RayT
MMASNKTYNRHSIRLRAYDYSKSGLYFITICTHNRWNFFGKIDSGIMLLNDAGKIANACWQEIPHHFSNIILHDFVIMPNHIHGIIEIANDGSYNVGAKNFSPKNPVDVAHAGAKNFSPKNPGDVSSVGAKKFSPKNPGDVSSAGAKNFSPKNPGDVSSAGAKNFSPLQGPSRTIGSVVRGFKIGVTKWMRNNTNIYTVWQRNYYDHIIRNEQSYLIIANYIKTNPQKWTEDKFFCK